MIKPVFKDLSIRLKLIFIIMIISSTALLLACVAFIVYDFFSYKNKMINDYFVIADIIAENNTAALIFGDAGAANESLKSLKANEHIVAACIIDESGTYLAVYNRDENYQFPDQPPVKKQRFSMDNKHLELYSEIAFEGKKIGAIYIKSEMNPLFTRLQRYLGIVGVILISSVLVVFLLTTKFHHVISKPILMLSQKALEVSRNKDYSIRIEKKGNDELGILINSFNEMLAQMENQNRELTDAKEKAQDSAKAKSHFLANMSHEIRTPMNGIMGLTHLLVNTEITDRQREYLNAIVTSSETLSVIVNDILDISKIEAGKLRIEKKSFKLKDTIGSVVEIFSGKAEEKNLKLYAEINDALPATIIGDAVRLNQILYNLIGNAIKFTKEGEIKLVVEAKSQDDSNVEIEFNIVDTGIGIVRSKLKYVFEAFAQAKNSTSRKYGGTGLGLTIVKRLVKLQGGSISVKSEPGNGSEFTFVIRYQKDKTVYADDSISGDGSEREKKNEQSLKLLKGVKVLLAEDNPVNQLVTRDLLHTVGVEVVVANNGVEAIRSLESAEFDIVLMDIQMPVMDGYQAMRHIRTEMEAEKQSIPILALTAHATEGEMEKCKKEGANDFLSKPFNPQDLFTKIAELVGKSFETPGIPGHDGLASRDDARIADFDALRNFTGGKVQLMITTIDVLITEFPENMRLMQEAVKEQEWERVGGLAHKIKPNMMLIGAVAQKEMLLKIEQDGKKRVQVDEIPGLVDQIESYIPQILEELKDEAETLKLELEKTPG